MRKNSLIVVMMVLTGLTAAGCKRITESGPDDVVKKYLDASLKGRYEEAYNYVSSEDKKRKDLSTYLQDKVKDNYASAVARNSQIFFKIIKLDKNNKTATADVEVTIGDLGYSPLVQETEGEVGRANEAEHKYEINTRPVKTWKETFHLVKQDNEWKVFFNWKNGEARREKKNNIDSLMAEAAKMKDAENLTGALEKYEEVLAIDPTMTVAKAGVEATKEEIKIVEDKKAYMPYIALYNLNGKYYSSPQGVKIPGVTFKLKNKGGKTLKEVEVTVYFKDNSGAVITEETFYPILAKKENVRGDNRLLKPNYIWQSEIGKFLKAPSVPSEWKEGSVSAEITNIEFKE